MIAEVIYVVVWTKKVMDDVELLPVIFFRFQKNAGNLT